MSDISETSMGTCTPPDTSGYVRRARRLADLSQRDLAEALETPQSRISRIESGQPLSVDEFARVLTIAGLRIAVVDEHGTEVAPMPADVLRDRAGRRRPAHLDSHAHPDKPTFKMLLRTCEPWTNWHHNRAERDRQRHETGKDARTEQLTISEVAARRASRRRQPRRGRMPS